MEEKKARTARFLRGSLAPIFPTFAVPTLLDVLQQRRRSSTSRCMVCGIEEHLQVVPHNEQRAEAQLLGCRIPIHEVVPAELVRHTATIAEHGHTIDPHLVW